MHSYFLLSSSRSSYSSLQLSLLSSSNLFLQSSLVSEEPQRSVHVNPAFVHLQRLLEHFSFVHVHFSRWMIASGVRGSVGITRIHNFSCSSHSSQSPLVMATLDRVLCRCSILVVDSGHGELFDAT